MTKEKTARKIGSTIAIIVGLVVWVGFCIYAAELLSYFGFKFLIDVFHFDGGGTIVQAIYSVVIYLLAILMMLGVPALIRKKIPKVEDNPLLEKTSREELGLSGLPTWTDILLSPVGFVIQLVVGGILVSLFSYVFPWFDATEAQATGFSDLYTTLDKIIAFLIIAVAAPIAEEIIFRGFLYGKLRKHTNLVVSILVTSVLFAFLHGQWNIAVNVFVTSVVLCGMREITGTIYSGILVHVIKNAVAFYLLFIAL